MRLPSGLFNYATRCFLRPLLPLASSVLTTLAKEFEGLERAKAQGKKLGRPKANSTTLSVQAKKAEGLSQAKVAQVLDLGIATVKRHWNKSSQVAGPTQK